MEIIIIGGSGHWGIARDAAALDKNLHITGIAPGRADEDMSAVKNAVDAPFSENWRQLVDKSHADLAVVNPWFCDSAEISCACLERGMHVYSEKPLATEHDSLKKLESAWRASGKALGGMFNYRWTPWFLAMEEAVNSGLIGELRQAHAQKSYRMGVRPAFYSRRETMGGIIPWVSIHAIDWACAFLGQCQWVSAAHSTRANRGNGQMEATSAVLMGLEEGRIATVTADFLRPDGSARHDDDRLRLTGDRGMAEVIDGEVYLENAQPKRRLTLPRPVNALAAFINAIESGNAEQFALSALHATRTALAARDSADENGARMSVEQR